jgi:hypothetical protein
VAVEAAGVLLPSVPAAAEAGFFLILNRMSPQSRPLAAVS